MMSLLRILLGVTLGALPTLTAAIGLAAAL